MRVLIQRSIDQDICIEKHHAESPRVSLVTVKMPILCNAAIILRHQKCICVLRLLIALMARKGHNTLNVCVDKAHKGGAVALSIRNSLGAVALSIRNSFFYISLRHC